MIEIIGLQGDVISGSPEKNLAAMKKLLDATHLETTLENEQVRWLITPELFLTGYDFKHLKQKQLLNLDDLDNPIGTELLDIMRKYETNLVIGFPEKEESLWFNTVAAIDVDGNILGKYQKIHLFKPFNEHQLFTMGRKDFVRTFRYKGVTYGLEICYDIRFPELSRLLTLQGAEIIFIPAQFPHPRSYVWETLLRARAIENQLFIVGVNRVGETPPNRFFGLSSVFDPLGMLKAQVKQDQEGVLTHAIDKNKITEIRSSLQCLRERRTDVYELSGK